MSELDQFKETYITECYELLEEMEEKLLGLDGQSADPEELNAIFRCAHSIKGGAGAFGFNELVKFTHILEALLDAMREGHASPTREAVDALLKSVDVVSQMVTAAKEDNDLPADFGANLAKELQDLVQTAVSAPVSEAPVSAGEESPQEEGEIGFYDITFKPHKGLFESGNEPLLIIRELKKIGKADVKLGNEQVPSLDDIDPLSCYLTWHIELETKKSIDVIREAFEFVEDECDLEIEEFAALSMPGKPEDEAAAVPANTSGQTDDPATPPPDVGAKRVVTSMRVDVDKVDRLVNMVGELVISQAMMVAQTRDLPQEQFAKLILGVEEFSQHTRELQEAVMSVRMQPVKSIFSRMPRIVRDLSTQLDKDIVIEMFGENTEIDKTVIEQLGDPLTHMIRNSVDHGIEKPEDRTANGKPAQGTIRLSADHSGGRIIIEIEDDGAGINREKVLEKAKSKELVAKDAHLSEEEIDNLIFLPGFSTAEAVTNVSGRGVGMDVVKRNIEDLGGTVEIKNSPGKGSRLTVSLPLTLAILDGMIVRVGAEQYIIPINSIIESLRPKPGDVEKVADGSDVINVRGEFIPILYLYQVFGVGDAILDASKALVVLVENSREKVGLVVDELVGQQQVVIKSIEENSDPVEGISGATILGDGKVSLILDIAGLQKKVGVLYDDIRNMGQAVA